jgi:hypothetical protein
VNEPRTRCRRYLCVKHALDGAEYPSYRHQLKKSLRADNQLRD